ncbi:putative ubiquitin-protein ligase UBR2 [Gigaspora margarita]|uniref:E3 ubiquitin-protein ligase n=1 Tax=Gigaspora margarita TaxID=4874 RepID=A0A8H4A772_GIGMA|nr:putative ubiquitin-protein ligase UBR2 [Gigaspora margarita]
MESELPAMNRLSLSNYLDSCPKLFGYRLTEVAQQKIIEQLFSEFWRSNEEYKSLFFPNGFGEGSDLYKLSSVEVDAITEYSPSQKGKACGHVFRKGESIYRCRNCALDDTCVFCSRCFHATNHEGHDITFSINSSGSGGCCDCGDAEAWKRPIHCSYHTLDTSSDFNNYETIQYEEQLPPDLLNSIHETISAVLDFILDTLTASPEDMSPPLNEDEVKQDAIKASYSIRNSINNVNNVEEKMFSVVLWNDEHHSFDEVIARVVEATQCTPAEAKTMAEKIDSYGRDIVEISDDIPRLITIARTISSIGLAVTVRSARDTFREGMCGLFIEWLKDLAGGNIGKNSIILKEIICEELCKEWKKPRRVRITKEKSKTSDDVFDDRQSENIQVENSYISDDEVMVFVDHENGMNIEDDVSSEYNQTNEYNIDDDMSMDEESNDTIDFMDEDEYILCQSEDFKKELRLDKLLLLDLRLWKEARAGLRELYIGSLIVNREYKKILGIRFARNYVKLAKAFLTPDREPEHSIVLFSVQLFTVPSISTVLVTQYNFLSTIFTILHTFFTSDTVGGPINLHAKIDCDSDSFKNRRYFHIFQDLRYIISNDIVKKAVPKQLHYLTQYLNLITLFQGMNPNVRATQQHVEYENDSWVNAFNATLQIAKSCRQYSECYAGDTATLCMTIHTVLRKLYEICVRNDDDTDKMDETSDDHLKEVVISDWGSSSPNSNGPFTRNSKFSDKNDDKDDTSSSIREPEFHDIIFPQSSLSFKVVKFEAASQPVSFHHPLHWFLAELLEHVDLLDDNMLKQHGWDNFQNMIMGFDIGSGEPSFIVQKAIEKILSVLDYPLRVLVLLAQIRAGLWVRNGFGIRGQCHHYREFSLRENTYDEDIFLIQTAMVILDPNLVLATILDRFDLVEWFNGETTHKIYDTSQLTFVAEELLALLIICVSERANAAGLTVEQEIRREIIHGLCLGSIAYSELTKRIPDRLTQDPLFDDILNQLSHYRSPDTLTDHGLYELNDQYFDEVDPYFIHYSRNNREEAEEALKNRMKKKMDNFEKQSTPLIVPKLIPITNGPYIRLGNMLHARLLNQIIFYSLWHVKTEEKIKSDTLIDEAFHLIMLALSDENNDIVRENKRKGKQKVSDTPITVDIDEGMPGFMYYATFDYFREANTSEMETHGTSLLDLLLQFSCEQSFKEFHHKIDFIINKFEQLGSDMAKMTITKHYEKIRLESQSKVGEEDGLSEFERKKQAAKERQKKIMEQFAMAQKSFIDKHEELYENDEMDQDLESPSAEDRLQADTIKSSETVWSYPTGTCIVCQEETNASSLYGMLGLVQPSKLLRHTPFYDKDYVFEAINCPENLDHKYDRSVPYGVASLPYNVVESGSSIPFRHFVSKGFPSDSCRLGSYASTCGHLMHVKCFDTYFASLEQRHQLQLARNHPENVSRKEFMCPLCKSLGNTLFPVIWKVKKEIHYETLGENEEFKIWLCDKIGSVIEKLDINVELFASRSLVPLSDIEFAQRHSSFALGSPTNNRDFTNNTGLPAHTLAQTIPNQQRRNSSGGRLRDAFTQIVQHMLRTPTTTQDVPTTVANDELPTLTTPTSSRADGSTTSEDEEQETIRRMYNRLAEVVQISYQNVLGDITFQSMQHLSVECIWDLFGYTISCVEISQRGVGENNPGATIVDSLSTQTLTILRILSETTITYINTMFVGQPAEANLKQIASYRVLQIFYGHPIMQQQKSTTISGSINDESIQNQEKLDSNLLSMKAKPLLLEDPFLLLVESSMNTASAIEYEISHLIRILFVAEVVKIIISVAESAINDKTRAWRNELRFNKDLTIECTLSESKSSSFRDFVSWILQQVGNDEHDIINLMDDIGELAFLNIIRTFCLPYLRKCMILLHSRFGIVFFTQTSDAMETEHNEFTRLSKLLRLPSLEEICSLRETDRSDTNMLAIIAGWCNHLNTLRQEPLSIVDLSGSPNNSADSKEPLVVTINHPAIFELVGLPKRLDSLFEESMRRTCKKCKSVPNDPALCLLCGTFVCSQSYCCSDETRGECYIHAKSCGGDIGIYLLVKKCVILLLHLENGCFQNAPYLDTHGEVDLGLKRGRPQFINQKRYDEIRKLWLTHGVPIHVARKIEQTFDLGGWPTM